MLPDPFAADCPSRQVLDRIGDRWSVLVILVLSQGTRRFSEVAGAIEGISQKMLTQTLRGLERDGLVTRTVYAEVPPRVEYELTPLGRGAAEPFAHLRDWVESAVGH